MNKRTVVTKENISKVEDFLRSSVKSLTASDIGCCHYNLSSDLAIYVGWSCGWDEDDTLVIHSDAEPEYALEAAVKIRNDGDCSDFESLDYPWSNDDTNDCWANGESISPSSLDEDSTELHDLAESLLKTFVDMTNAAKANKIRYYW